MLSDRHILSGCLAWQTNAETPGGDPPAALALVGRDGMMPGGKRDVVEGKYMWRVIVRISFFHDLGSRLRNHLVPMFTAMGLHNTHTGTWESAGVNLAQAAAQMNLVLRPSPTRKPSQGSIRRPS